MTLGQAIISGNPLNAMQYFIIVTLHHKTTKKSPDIDF